MREWVWYMYDGYLLEICSKRQPKKCNAYIPSLRWISKNPLYIHSTSASPAYNTRALPTLANTLWGCEMSSCSNSSKAPVMPVLLLSLRGIMCPSKFEPQAYSDFTGMFWVRLDWYSTVVLEYLLSITYVVVYYLGIDISP